MPSSDSTPTLALAKPSPRPQDLSSANAHCFLHLLLSSFCSNRNPSLSLGCWFPCSPPKRDDFSPVSLLALGLEIDKIFLLFSASSRPFYHPLKILNSTGADSIRHYQVPLVLIQSPTNKLFVILPHHCRSYRLA